MFTKIFILHTNDRYDANDLLDELQIFTDAIQQFASGNELSLRVNLREHYH